MQVRSGLVQFKVKLMRYVTIIEKTLTNYSACVSDLPGCVATGNTVEEASSEISSAIAFYVDGLQLEGMPIPEATTLCEYIEA
jgi:predicted RNase H-like HicB family nuclease